MTYISFSDDEFRALECGAFKLGSIDGPNQS